MISGETGFRAGAFLTCFNREEDAAFRVLEERKMNRIVQEPDGSYHWDCPIDIEYHRNSGRKGLWGILIICTVVLIIFIIISHGTNTRVDIWIPLLVIGVVLMLGLPLIYLWNTASDPREQYVMTEDYVRSGYGKSSIYSEFKKCKEAVVTAKYIEITGNHHRDRIYVPEEDMDFVREFILTRIPDDAVIRHG